MQFDIDPGVLMMLFDTWYRFVVRYWPWCNDDTVWYLLLICSSMLALYWILVFEHYYWYAVRYWPWCIDDTIPYLLLICSSILALAYLRCNTILLSWSLNPALEYRQGSCFTYHLLMEGHTKYPMCSHVSLHRLFIACPLIFVLPKFLLSLFLRENHHNHSRISYLNYPSYQVNVILRPIWLT